MKLLRFFFFVMLMFCIKSVHAFNDGDDKKFQQKKSLKRIVIDPGHGGYPSAGQGNYGASSKYGDEKDIALAVALKLQKNIQEQLPDVEVFLTRTTDVFENVRTKADRANAAKGDLFISLHCNDVPPIRHTEVVGYTRRTIKRRGKKIVKKIPEYKVSYTPNPAKGTETYIWGVDKNSQKEDAVAEGGEFSDSTDVLVKEMDDPIKRVEIGLRVQQYKERSQLFAQTIEDEFVKAGRVSRGVKQRQVGIHVLAAVNMPAILIEMGFLSNDEEASFLGSEKGQQETADAITEAIKRYKYSLDNKMQAKDSTSPKNK